jgi:hypothetical protein
MPPIEKKIIIKENAQRRFNWNVLDKLDRKSGVIRLLKNTWARS